MKRRFLARPSLILDSRRGWTLIQLLVSISILGVLSTAAITLVISAMRTEAHAATAWINDRQFARLTDDWRSDAHAARFAEIIRQNGHTKLIFKADANSSRLVSYSWESEQVIRRETADDKLVRSERYRLPNWSVTFDGTASKDGSVTMQSGESLKLTCRRPFTQPLRSNIPQPRREDSVVAVLGRDRRFEKPEVRNETK